MGTLDLRAAWLRYVDKAEQQPKVAPHALPTSVGPRSLPTGEAPQPPPRTVQLPSGPPPMTYPTTGKREG